MSATKEAEAVARAIQEAAQTLGDCMASPCRNGSCLCASTLADRAISTLTALGWSSGDVWEEAARVADLQADCGGIAKDAASEATARYIASALRSRNPQKEGTGT